MKLGQLEIAMKKARESGGRRAEGGLVEIEESDG
jgi:hypothetical protein